jgi:beta-lactamase superfamily II metal-dependent hydrolase
VGHGDCSVVTWSAPAGPGGQPGRTRCILIDGGEEGAKGVRDLLSSDFTAAQRLDAYLKLCGIRYIDLLVATHIDSDHIGGLVTFLEELTAKTQATNDRFWNADTVCIGQYWGPLADENGSRFGPDRIDERNRYRQAVKLLVKLKLKKKQQLTPADQAEIERLEAEVARLQEALGQTLDAHTTRAHLQRSIEDNASLSELLRAHVANPGRDVLHPDLLHPPASPFDDLEVDLLWPEVQLADTMQETAFLRPVNVRTTEGPHSSETLPKRRPGDVLQLLERILDNQEYLACQEDRKANNQSLVVRVRPLQWAGSPETWPVILFAGDAESASWKRMVQGYRDGQLAAYVLKVPHHGSAPDSGLTPEALAAIGPRYAVISVGQIHRLPAAETLNLLRSATGADVFCTERNHMESKRPACCPTPAGCVRKEKADYRGVVFSFNTETGESAVTQLQLEKDATGYHLRRSVVRDAESDPRAILWCRQQAWPG